ncbi:MAG TPA: hypothetical protein VGR19_01270 [Allosphingosinicella sp.]|nr:hypothetical protein [Allosphingosinicella sp.]
MATRGSTGATQNHSGGRPPKKVKLKLTIEAVDRETGEVTSYRFKQDSGEPCVNGKGDLDFKDKAKWDAPVEIGFKVDNESGCTMAFADPPLWVARDHCPKSPSSEPDFQVHSAQGLELTVLDLNGAAATYGYALRFQSGESQTGVFLLDPVVTNGGGGGYEH